MSAITPRQYGGRIEYRHDDGPLIVFDRLDPSSRGLRAWVEIRIDGVPPRLLHFGSYDLEGARTVSSIARAAHERDDSVPWGELVAMAVYDVINRENLGATPVRLAEHEPEDAGKWLLRPLVGRTGATSLVAPGEAGKSLLCLAVACAVASGDAHYLGMRPAHSGPVLYLDWEADSEAHHERLRALSGDRPAPKDVFYRTEKLPLSRSADALAKFCDREGVALVVVDSVMLARAGDSNAPEDNIRFYSALRYLGPPSLLVEHKSKEAIQKKRRGAYGSIVSQNSARMVWEITTVMPTRDGRLLRLENLKANNTRRMPDLAFRVQTASDDDDRLTRARIRQADPNQVVPLPDMDTGTSADRIRDLLIGENEPRTVSDIADALDMSEDTVRRVLNRHADTFANVAAPGQPGLWKAAGQHRDEGRQDDLPDPY